MVPLPDWARALSATAGEAEDKAWVAPRAASSQASSLLRGLLTRAPDDRYGLADLVANDFITAGGVDEMVVDTDEEAASLRLSKDLMGAVITRVSKSKEVRARRPPHADAYRT